jgi:hypothetical protein
MKHTPRVFSINLAAYLLMTTELKPEYGTDEETGSTYFVFPEVAAVKIAIAEFRYGKPLVKLHDYLSAIRTIRNAMRERKEGDRS